MTKSGLQETIEWAISRLIEGDYDDGNHPLVGEVIKRLRKDLAEAENAKVENDE